MDRRDLRSIGRSAQEELRRRAVFLVEHDGLTQTEAGRIVGVERQAVNIWLRRYRAEGDDDSLDSRRVSPCRGKRPLSEAEAGKVRLDHRQDPGLFEASFCPLDLTGDA